MRGKNVDKRKVKWIIKRLPYILKMLHGGECGMSVYISGEKKQIVIGNDVLTMLEIMGEIIEHEKMELRKKLFREIKKGNKDVSIMMDTPMGRTKYYEAKKGSWIKFINAVYLRD